MSTKSSGIFKEYQHIIHRFLSYQKTLGSSESSLRNWQWRLQKFHHFFTGLGKSLLNSNQDDYHLFMIEFGGDRKLLNRTLREYFGTLRTFYDFCERMKVPHHADMKTLERLRYMRVEPRPVRLPFSVKEIGMILDQPLRQIHRLIRLLTVTHILYASGLRVSELLALKMDDVDKDKACCSLLLNEDGCAFAHHLHDAGADILVIQKLLGHQHVSSTQRYLPAVSMSKMIREYRKLFDHPAPDLAIIKDRPERPAILKKHDLLKRVRNHHGEK